MKTNYFRQDIWIKIWIQFHFQYIFEGRDDFIHTRHIIVPPQIDCCKLGPPWSIKHVGTSWTLFCKRKLRYLGRNNLEGKKSFIFQIAFSQWRAGLIKKLFWDVFLRLASFVFMKNFRSISPALHVLSKKMPNILSYLRNKDFSTKIFTVLHQSKKRIIRFGSKLSKNQAFTFQNLEILYFNGQEA